MIARFLLGYLGHWGVKVNGEGYVAGYYSWVLLLEEVFARACEPCACAGLCWGAKVEGGGSGFIVFDKGSMRCFRHSV